MAQGRARKEGINLGDTEDSRQSAASSGQQKHLTADGRRQAQTKSFTAETAESAEKNLIRTTKSTKDTKKTKALTGHAENTEKHLLMTRQRSLKGARNRCASR